VANSSLNTMKGRPVALLAALTSLTACASGSQAASRLSGVQSAPVSSPAVSSSPPGLDVPDSAFRVAAPVLDFAAGPGPPPVQTPCTPADVSATTQTRPIATGVAGVVELVGDHCSLHISSWPMALLDASGNTLALPVDSTVAAENPALNQRSDVPLGLGIVGWGFTWRGSWCGPAATAIAISLDPDSSAPVSGSANQIVVPLTAPAPSCQGHTDAVFVPGVPGGPTDATLTPPPDWAGLRATLQLPATTDGHTLPAEVVELRNTTAVPITISPCPDYALDIDSAVSNGTEMDGGGGALSCPPVAQIIPANGVIRYHLDARSYDEGDGASRGSIVTARFAIAGIPTAIATLRVN
jgi:hypothetical protein